jgi:DNA polymerase II large subunit
MLRHSRAMTRHHRNRVIKSKAKRMLNEFYPYSHWLPEPIGKLAKYAAHHHACSMCTTKYKRDHKKDWLYAQEY